MNSGSKKLIASFAALQILIYHCWMPVFGYDSAAGAVERFMISSTYTGVDMFFFLSAYSLVSRPVEDYGRFMANRAVKLLPLFLVALAAGRFMWFIPSIMAVYSVLPLLHRICRKDPRLSLIVLISGWVGLLYLVLGFIRPPWDLGIFLFRIPSVILGAYSADLIDKITVPKALIAGTVLMIAGILLIYEYGYINRIDIPFRGAFYLTGIPAMLGTVLILNAAGSVLNSRITEFFGSMTFELYFSQMVFGAPVVKFLYGMTAQRAAVNAGTMITVAVLAFIVKKLNDKLLHAAGFKSTSPG